MSVETSTENITVSIDDDNSTTVEQMTTTSAFVDTTMEEVLESSTTKSVETTTTTTTTTTTMKVETTTIARSNLCDDSEFECCPDGKTPAKVIDLLGVQTSASSRIYQGSEFQGCNTTEKWVPSAAKTPSSSKYSENITDLNLLFLIPSRRL